ncbi:MAG TPA: amino acid ABC transporter permease [Gemmatimonadaceae bacterium]|nr:amino acid ABC transporter permease [Gemmatimonadaceae bacterium]
MSEAASPAARMSPVTTAIRRSFATPAAAALTVIVAGIAAAVVVPLARWALVGATWSGTADDCRRAAGGACWAFIGHKAGFILFGLYPAAQRWRPGLAAAVLVALVVCTAIPRCWTRWLLAAWALGLALAFVVMHGGLGLTVVPTQRWGGLPVTIMLTALGLAGGFPIGVVLALGRRSRRPLPRAVAGAIVEVVRGVPLIAVLYVAVLVFPLALPTGVSVDKLALAQAAVIVFASAYLAEAVRSGLQLVPARRLDAGLALGLSWWQTMQRIVLPEALRTVLPSFISIAVGFFQDTSLIVIIGLFDLLNTARSAAQDPNWLGFYTEAFVFVGAIYFCGSAALSRYGLWLERRMAREHPAVRASQLLTVTARPD